MATILLIASLLLLHHHPPTLQMLIAVVVAIPVQRLALLGMILWTVSLEEATLK